MGIEQLVESKLVQNTSTQSTGPTAPLAGISDDAKAVTICDIFDYDQDDLGFESKRVLSKLYDVVQGDRSKINEALRRVGSPPLGMSKERFVYNYLKQFSFIQEAKSKLKEYEDRSRSKK